MELSDFCEQFNAISVGKVYDNYHYNSILTKYPNNEKFSYANALKFASKIEQYTKEKGSFIIWNKEKKFSDSNKDPNYLTA